MLAVCVMPVPYEVFSLQRHQWQNEKTHPSLLSAETDLLFWYMERRARKQKPE